MIKAVTYIEQFGFDPFTVSEIQSYFLKSSVVAENQREFENVSEFSMYGAPLAQNPRPYNRYLIITSDRDDWSDSPENDPDLLVWKRYAYGRGTSDVPLLHYGELKNDSGLLITQKDFFIDSSSRCGQITYNSSGDVAQKEFELTSYVREVQNLVVSSDGNVEQFNFLLYAIPVPYSYKNPVDTDVFIRMSNYGSFPLDPDSVVLFLDGIRYYTSDLVITPFYSGNGGLEISWTNINVFNYGRRINVYWEFYDTDTPPNRVILRYWFCTVEDLIGPRIINESPEEDSTGALISTYITFDIVDFEAGVNINTLKVYVNNILISNSNLSIVQIQNGYRIQHSPITPFVYGDVVPIAVFVSDLSDKANASFRAWSFSVEGSAPPVIVNMSPSPCDKGVSRVGNISFEIVDAGNGIKEGSISVGVDNKVQEDVYIVPIIHRFQ